MAIPVQIAAVGARTPLGLEVAPSAAAHQAGISAIGTHPFMIDRYGDPMPGALDSLLDPGLMGPERLVALAESALREACALLRDSARVGLRMPIVLGLPELRPGFTEQDAESVRAGLSRIDNLPIEVSEVKTATAGHAAGLMALGSATEQIGQGALDACLVGGVDSYFQPDTMEWLDRNRQLVGMESRSAFVPGEGAGFCLLVSQKVRSELNLSNMANVLSVAVGSEGKLIKTSDVCLGEGLTETVRAAIGGLHTRGEKVNDVICDINGERYRGEEWGFVCLRLAQHMENPTGYLSPADLWGDMGAASGPLFVMLACQAAKNGYAYGPHTLVWASSEHGQRSAALLGLQETKWNRTGTSYDV